MKIYTAYKSLAGQFDPICSLYLEQIGIKYACS